VNRPPAAGRSVEDLLREVAPQALGSLVRRYGAFDAAEDAVQEALIAASARWPVDGTPDNPLGWLTTVASRRLVDEWRSESARRRREERAATLDPAEPIADRDDTLTLVFLCCHPALSAPSRIALTLRAVGGLTTAEIASAFLVPEATMAQRISRAKATIAQSGARFELPSEPDRDERLASVLQVLYLIFNEGYTASSGDVLQRTDLTAEAIRLARMLHDLLPDEAEVTGLLGLMLLTEARRAARVDDDGLPVPLAEQDRSRWDAALIEEAGTLLDRTVGSAIGPYRVQAAIAMLHDDAPSAEDTDWPRILALYDVLERVAPGAVVALNRAVAVAMVRGPRDALAILERLAADPALERSHRLDAVRGHLLELAGDTASAREAYRRAARKATSVPEQRYLSLRAARSG
jgi:RNA polymerase sigma factor (sigma-70 family)